MTDSEVERVNVNREENESDLWDLDDVLKNLKFDWFQVRYLILIGFLVFFSNVSLSYVLTTADLEYRCLVPECESANNSGIQYTPSWIRNAIPFKNGEPKKCKRYEPVRNESFKSDDECSTSFDHSDEKDCNAWIFATDEVNIVNEFGILCENRKWELSLIGTINNMGLFIGIPLFGVLSDRFGRKFIVIIMSLLSAACGTCKGFSTSYANFACFEFLDSFFGSAIYITAFTMGLEFANPKMRAVVSSTIALFYPCGAITMGCLAWYFRNWRQLLIATYAPGLLIVFYIWMIPESIRWLQTKGRYAEANDILRKMLSPNDDVDLLEKMSQKLIDKSRKQKKASIWKSLIAAFYQKLILFRVLCCSFIWFASALVYYGLLIHSVELVGNKYLNFILMNVVELPGIVASGYVMEKVKRRISLSAIFFLCGASCFIFEFIPQDMYLLPLLIYLIGKLLISMAFCIIYVYTAEIFPTELRQSLSGLASMFGRVGSMIAPQTILLSDMVGKHASVLLFAIASVIAGCLVIFLPETSNKNLPDTINEAKLENEYHRDSIR